MMNRLFVLMLGLLSLSLSATAQDVDVDKKTGLVQVDGVDAFYLTPKNKQLFVSDYSLENLQHKELAYLKYTSYPNVSYYYMVFTKTGNQCMLKDNIVLGNIKHLAKMIAGANLVQANAVSEEEERKFIILHNGTFIRDPAATPPPAVVEKIIVASDNQRKTQVADIMVKENKIYNSSELVGVFKKTTEQDVTYITVYNANDAMICKASHPDKNKDADWNLLLDDKAVTLLYNPSAPLEKLFKYLVEKGYL